jgi:8-oxo-dGTP pyrophosphatase MutT (NUDIX family)
VTLHDDALATLEGWRAPDGEQDRLRRRYVDHLHAHTDGLARTDVPAHLTAGALVVSADGSQVLLTLHAKAGRWFHLGGHCEPGDATLAGAALREATEESGMPDLVLDPEPLHLDAHTVDFCGDRAQVEHLDVRYLAVAPAGARPVVSDESLDVRWWPVTGLPTDEPGLRRMVELAGARQRSSAAI